LCLLQGRSMTARALVGRPYKRYKGTKRAREPRMNFYNRLTQCYFDSRSAFILFTEFIAFVGTMATVVGMAVLFSLFH
jgi:hypothetical protein